MLEFYMLVANGELYYLLLLLSVTLLPNNSLFELLMHLLSLLGELLLAIIIIE